MVSGGYRQPAHPAPVSGPGALSKRTDGGPGSSRQPLRAPNGLPYGDRQGLLDQEKTAAMAQQSPIPAIPIPAAPQGPPTAQTAAHTAPYSGVPFGAPTQRPGEPVTQGINFGPGAGNEVLPQPVQQQVQPQGPMSQALSQMGGLTGQLAALYNNASARGA